MSDNNNSYEWLGDDELSGEKDQIAREIMGSESASGYVPRLVGMKWRQKDHF